MTTRVPIARASASAEQAGAVLFVTVLTADRGADQRAAAVHAGAVHVSADGRAGRRARRSASRLGMASQVLYLALGIAGLPVFAASPLLPQGAARLLGPTGGYLMSYPLAAFVTGSLAERGFDRRYLDRGPRDGLRPRGHLRRRRPVAHDRVAAGAVFPPRSPPASSLHHRRPVEAAGRGGVMPGLWRLRERRSLARPKTSRNRNGGIPRARSAAGPPLRPP